MSKTLKIKNFSLFFNVRAKQIVKQHLLLNLFMNLNVFRDAVGKSVKLKIKLSDSSICPTQVFYLPFWKIYILITYWF